jgi:DNA-binding IclR family transcriptional regulator
MPWGAGNVPAPSGSWAARAPRIPMPRTTRPHRLDRYRVPVLDRTLDLLETLAERPEGMTLTGLTEALGMPKNTVFRIATTLSLRGYVDREEATKRYRLNRRLLSVSHAAIGGARLLEAAGPVLRSLRDATGETALLGTLSGARGVVLDQVPSSQPVKVVVEVGHAFPLHTAAPAKAMLAFLPEEARCRLVSEIRFTRHTPRTITSARALARELAAVRRLGHAFDRREESEAYACAAAPVFDRAGDVVAAVWVSGPSDRVTTARLPALGRQVAAAAQTLSTALGHAASAGSRSLNSCEIEAPQRPTRSLRSSRVSR